ncbi:hypothetical protein Csa_017545 [Cucumis sativus]|uniref:Uncharacterized protein n=1 Tax=Cucumis sativus TaxID=3659 RepID=A0A0A0LBX1_CUCSA|nr:hypothetical protein Csa_017545 [Cucumis sativus]
MELFSISKLVGGVVVCVSLCSFERRRPLDPSLRCLCLDPVQIVSLFVRYKSALTGHLSIRLAQSHVVNH